MSKWLGRVRCMFAHVTEHASDTPIELLVNQDAHQGKGACGVLSKASGQSQFEKCLGLLAAYAWEAVEELLEGISGLQVNDKAISTGTRVPVNTGVPPMISGSEGEI